jgi:hypothetical protein
VTGARWLTLALCGLLFAALPLGASAEPRSGRPSAREQKKARPARPAKKARAAKARPKRGTDARRARGTEPKREAPAAEPNHEAGEAKRAEHTAPVNPAQKAAQEAAQGANSEIVKEGDTSVKVMSFSGLDIEGRLKSPQLLYFVNRVHAEFDRPKLPHRSFMPELERSTEQEPVR